jgi:hypothetical protein
MEFTTSHSHVCRMTGRSIDAQSVLCGPHQCYSICCICFSSMEGFLLNPGPQSCRTAECSSTPPPGSRHSSSSSQLNSSTSKNNPGTLESTAKNRRRRRNDANAAQGGTTCQAAARTSSRLDAQDEDRCQATQEDSSFPEVWFSLIEQSIFTRSRSPGRRPSQSRQCARRNLLAQPDWCWAARQWPCPLSLAPQHRHAPLPNVRRGCSCETRTPPPNNRCWARSRRKLASICHVDSSSIYRFQHCKKIPTDTKCRLAPSRPPHRPHPSCDQIPFPSPPPRSPAPLGYQQSPPSRSVEYPDQLCRERPPNGIKEGIRHGC